MKFKEYVHETENVRCRRSYPPHSVLVRIYFALYQLKWNRIFSRAMPAWEMCPLGRLGSSYMWVNNLRRRKRFTPSKRRSGTVPCAGCGLLTRHIVEAFRQPSAVFGRRIFRVFEFLKIVGTLHRCLCPTSDHRATASGWWTAGKNGMMRFSGLIVTHYDTKIMKIVPYLWIILHIILYYIPCKQN